MPGEGGFYGAGGEGGDFVGVEDPGYAVVVHVEVVVEGGGGEEFLIFPLGAEVVVDCVGEEIQKVLSELIRTVKDPRVRGLISVTHVDTTSDLKYAKVYVSVLDKSDRKDVLKGLKSASGYLRRELGHTLSLRATPELTFLEDDSIDKGARILELMENLDREGRL